MKFETLIIGGGLSGLVCGIKLASKGIKCAIVSSGQNAMHFSSGAINVLNYDAEGKVLESPFKGLEKLPANHPYSKIGTETIKKYLSDFQEIAAQCGTLLNRNGEKNGWRISPVGKLLPCWASFDEVGILDSCDFSGKTVLVVGIEDYLDFDANFIAAGLEKHGAQCKVISIGTEATRKVRTNPTEMRSTNLAKIMENRSAMTELISEILKIARDEDFIVLPSIFALKSSTYALDVKDLLEGKALFAGTLPPSVPGIRVQNELKKQFEALGGTFFNSDTVLEGQFEGNKLKSVRTENLEEVLLEADNFVLCSGGFFSKGLNATPSGISECAFGLDTESDAGRENWYQRNFFAPQAYLGFGVKTDSEFHCFKEGSSIENLYAAGSVLSGYNPIEEGSGAGVAICTALCVADKIN